MKISVSYLKSRYDLKSTIKRISSTSADFLHLDLMDGKFVQNNNINIIELKDNLKDNKKPLDIHLMTNDIDTYISEIKELNPKYVTFHLEAPLNTREEIKKIKEMGIGVGLSIKPKTDISKLKPFLKDLDLVLVMSVEPGMGGQKFLNTTLEKLKKLKDEQPDYHYLISVDGGINEQTINLIRPYVDIAVSGSFICEYEDYETQIKKLR